MTDNKEFATCAFCGRLVKKGDMYFEARFFDKYEIIDGEYVYKEYAICEDCHNNVKQKIEFMEEKLYGL